MRIKLHTITHVELVCDYGQLNRQGLNRRRAATKGLEAFTAYSSHILRTSNQLFV